MNKEEKAKLWADRIQQCKTSGQTCKQWCAENGIPLSTMGYWTRRLAKEALASEPEQDLVFARLPSEQEAARKLLSEETAPVRIFISDKRIEEIDAEVWTDDDLSDDEIEARYAKYDDEITSLNAQIETLEKKADWYEGYYGNLSEDEVNQLNGIYNKIDAIYDNIYNGSDNLSEEEFAFRYAKYSDEIDALEAQAIALEAKAGCN